MLVKEGISMTSGQRQKIKTLRYQGVGYGKIAKTTGVSRDSVRNYCIREGLSGYASELVTEYRKVLKEEMLFIVCLNCGMKLEQNWPYRDFMDTENV